MISSDLVMVISTVSFFLSLTRCRRREVTDIIDYLYNWQCAPIDGGMTTTSAKKGAGIGVVML